MADLRPEKDWLISYCMESEENTRLALRIGQIRENLERLILREFFGRLAESIGPRLKECTLGSKWHCKPDEIVQYKEAMAFPVTRQDQIALHLQHSPDSSFRVGVPKECTACPEADLVQPHLEDRSLKLLTSQGAYWRWWFHPKDDHRWIKDLASLRDEQVAKEKAEYFTYVLVDSARAISMALED